VFETKVLKIFRPMREVTGEWRKLHNKKLHSFYSSNNNIIRVIKSTRMSWAGCVRGTGRMRNVHKTKIGKPQGK
jgi:hypothetical protein